MIKISTITLATSILLLNLSSKVFAEDKFSTCWDELKEFTDTWNNYAQTTAMYGLNWGPEKKKIALQIQNELNEAKTANKLITYLELLNKSRNIIRSVIEGTENLYQKNYGKDYKKSLEQSVGWYKHNSMLNKINKLSSCLAETDIGT